MSPSLAALIGALAASALLAGSGAASAETIAVANPAAMGSGFSAADAPLGAPTELRIDLTGRIAPRCELTTAPADVSSLDMARAGGGQSAFAIDCNAPFTLRVRSGRGGFASVDPTPGIETLVPYQLALAVNTDAGRQDLGWCDSAALTDVPSGACVFSPGQGWSSGDASAINQTGALHLRWAPAAGTDGAPRLGDYQDTIVIELEVRS